MADKIKDAIEWRGEKASILFKGKAISNYISKYGRNQAVILGRGSFGAVYKMKIKEQNTGTFRNVAIKQIPYKQDKNTEVELAQQANEGIGLDHPNVYQFYGVVQFDNNLMIIMELCDGNIDALGRRLRRVPELSELQTGKEARSGAMPEPIVSRVFAAIASGLVYLYEKLIYHSDIKVENVLYNRKSTDFKLCDFGVSSRRSASNMSGADLNKVCTINIPPETMKGSMALNQSLDIWSLGILIYHFAFNAHPVGQKLEAQGISNPNQMHYVHELKSLGEGAVGKSAYPMVTTPYSDSFNELYNTMTTVNPLHRRRYKTKNSPDKNKKDNLRPSGYLGPAEGIVDTVVYSQYSNDAMKDENCKAYYDVMKIMLLLEKTSERPVLKEPSASSAPTKPDPPQSTEIKPAAAIPAPLTTSTAKPTTGTGYIEPSMTSQLSSLNIKPNSGKPAPPIKNKHAKRTVNTAPEQSLPDDPVVLRKMIEDLRARVKELEAENRQLRSKQ